MKTPLFILLSSLILLPSAFSQGSLTPPGAPGPTMKTLQQIEPRTPISSLPFTITQPGSYYLMSNLTSTGAGISVAASSVTIDLMGFEMTGPGGTSSGIWVANIQTDIAVRNGTLSGWSIGLNMPNARNSLFEKLRTSRNGLAGMWVAGLSNIIRDCSAYENEGVGIFVGRGSIVSNCIAEGNGGDGIRLFRYAQVESSVATANGGNGISGGLVSRVLNCTSTLNGDAGIFVDDTSVVEGCLVNANGGDGIRALSQSVVRNNTVDFHLDGSAGIHIEGSGSRIEDNNVTRNAHGIRVLHSGNLIVKNSARGNTTNNFTIVAGNQLGPTGNMATAGDHPWANFSY